MRSAILALLMPLAVAGCTVGPRHVEPDAAVPASFDQADDSEAEATGPVSTLWSAFGSAELDALLVRAVAANQDIAIAAARLAETRALAGLSIYAYIPTVTAGGDVMRRQESLRDPSIPERLGETETWRAGFDASWEIDLFGSLRNQASAIYRRVDAQAAALEAVRQSVVAETAQAWFALIGARERLALLGQQQANLVERVRILRAQLDAGRATAFDVARAEAESRSVAATVPGAEAEVVRQEQRLAVLTAWPVAELRAQLDPAAAMPELPSVVNTGTPEEWLRRRPDIREAERRLAAATSDVGVEVAEYFPKLELMGSFGWTAGSSSGIGSPQAERWSYGPVLSWRFLDFGRVTQGVRAAEARRDAALAGYNGTVLRALEETENALAGLRAANRSATELGVAVEAAGEAAGLAQLRYSAGATDYLAVLDAERTWLELADRLVQVRTQRATSLAAVHKALAGDP
ncbi:MAG: TolC family protein [Steroidobacteraceae bacterium]|jgi:multidrug efflux system outer membrane protein|nr:TolC family protein [Steroidobacteraceae bacterium]